MEIGDWRSTRDLNDLYRQIRELGLETNLAELDAFGFTVIEDALSPELTASLRDAVVREAETAFAARLDVEREKPIATGSWFPIFCIRIGCSKMRCSIRSRWP